MSVRYHVTVKRRYPLPSRVLLAAETGKGSAPGVSSGSHGVGRPVSQTTLTVPLGHRTDSQT